MSNKKQEFKEPLLDNLDTIDSKGVIERYVEFAPVYNYSVHQWGYEAPIEAAQHLKHHLPLATTKIFDAGCGTGLVGKALADLAYTEIIGMDLSPDMLAIAQKTSYYKKLEQHDLTKIPYPFDDNSFEAIMSIGVLSLIKDPMPVFSEFHRLIQANGYMIFTQRDNLYIKYNYDVVLKELESEGLICPILISEPKNYLPNRENFSHRKLITYIYQVIK
ncbi:SAM-dependent methlyltransferase [Candidatus Magnetomorum sp. HK-1]|nr:SAM-dependent methlyltransferase [Candidatus Magnetomorum sp. HK-1]